MPKSTSTANAVDADEARQVGVAVPPASKDEYLEASSQLQPGFVATVDATDPSVGWTSQQMNPDREMAGDGEADVRGFRDAVDDTPGQVYLPEQLPDPQQALAAGLTPQKIPEHLITDDENHPQGLELVERLGREVREELRGAVVAHRQGQLSDLESEPAGASAKDARKPASAASAPNDNNATASGGSSSSGSSSS